MTPTELELIATRDHDAMARFYDRHVAMVGEFCAAVCPDERVDEAVAAVFLNFLSRATEAQQDVEPEELLRRAARDVAASRMEAEAASGDEQGDPVCRAIPELLAARVNGELPGQVGLLAEHVAGCPTCQAAAARLGQAEVMFPVGSAGGVTELRAEWLQLAGDTNKAADAEPQSKASAAESRAPQEQSSPVQEQSSPPQEQSSPAQEQSSPPQEQSAPATSDREPPREPPIRGRVRRGGLVGTVRRWAGAPGAEPPRRRPPGGASN